MTDEEFPSVHTGNGFQNDLIATTNDRIKRQVIATNDLHDSIKELNSLIKNFAKTTAEQTSELINLTSSLKDLNQDSSKQTIKLIILTKWIILLTLILVIGLIIQIVALF